MATIHLPSDFKEFLKLLNAHQVEYLLIGGYAVGYHGYPRATADMDIWIAMNPSNSQRIVIVLKEFGFDLPELSPELFLKEWQIIRMGVPPIRIELATTISGVNFDDCYAERLTDTYIYPLARQNGRLQVAVADPLDSRPLNDLSTLTGEDIEPWVTTPEEILRAINRGYEKQAGETNEVIEEIEEKTAGDLVRDLEPADLIDASDEAPIIRFVN
ncbi:MAG: hypothetical protein RQ760_16220, partial [Sedimentisphaerales bacterium]|nr:hypothetical protein [Sedimentisphaerales bacterium]